MSKRYVYSGKKASGYLDLIYRRSSKEYNLREPTVREGAVTDPADDLVATFDDRQTLRVRVVY